MIDTQVRSVGRTTPTERLITKFIEHWERSWKEAVRYDSSERAMIRAHLYLSVAKRYLVTGGQEVHFTKQELKSAIQSALEVVNSAGKSYRVDREAGDICACFISARVATWELRDEFTDDEMTVIRSKLYSDALDRYRRSGYSDLHVTKREFQKAVEMVEAIRQRDERRQRSDDRDRRIRMARKKAERQIVRQLDRV